MSSLVDYYNDFIYKNKLEERKGIEQTLRKLENGENVILKAPTGYGKTTLTKILANAVERGNEVGSRVIHVLPLRAIVQDLYIKLMKDSKDGKIYTRSIGAQDMDYFSSPFFMKKVTVTTLDTFVMNLFKLPPVESRNIFNNYGSHYELPRAMIYSSIVIFDEAHLIGEEGRPLTAFLASLKVLSEVGVPIVIMSATIDEGLEKTIKNYINVETIKANDFSIKRNITVSKIDDPIEDARNQVKKGKRVLLTFNTRRDAIDSYMRLRDLNPVLIHSKFNRFDRIELMWEVLDRNTKLVISTQVIEAGIDTTFDVLITEAAPAHNLIQRAGRVARYGGNGEVHVFPFRGKVYDEKEVSDTYNRINNGIDDSLLVRREYKVDNTLLHDLTVIDSIYADAKRAKSLYEQVCNIVRDTSIILGFPPHSDSTMFAIPLSEDEAKKLIEKGYSLVPEGRSLNTLNCLQLQMIKNSILGVRIKGYSREIGGILE
jgi:CRISPR-associated endonuclease/helicase Cas3